MKQESSNTHRPRGLWRALALLLICALAVAGCNNRPQSGQNIEPTRQAEPTKPSSEEPKPQEVSYFVPNQIVLSGPTGQIDEVIGGATKILSEADPKIRFARVSVATMDELAQLGAANCSLLPTLQEQRYAVVQYQVTSPEKLSLAQITQAIEQARQGMPGVAQELNWLTGAPPQTIAGNPWGPEGSPWGPEGSPWGPEGSPWGPEGSPWGPEGSPWGPEGSRSGAEVLGVGGTAFRAQWAFGAKSGIDAQAARQPAAQEAGGKGVLVGVFDTSPFPPPMTATTFVMAAGEQPWTLNLVHPIPGGRPAGNTKTNVPNHGLFAAGLVHAVAPQSSIELIRVLDDTGQGDMQTLNRALIAFIQRVASSPDVRSAVINLSLGLHLLPEEEAQDLPADVQSLRTILQVATECYPIVVAAASGNDSAGPEPASQANIPAIWGMDPAYPGNAQLIAVAASNQAKAQSCFSNDGEVAAPGGDGGRAAGECIQVITECKDDCPYGLLSLSTSSPSGYTYWNGTSFAAPLVSGQAALLLGNGLAAPDVEACILSTATSGSPISVANVQQSLVTCRP